LDTLTIGKNNAQTAANDYGLRASKKGLGSGTSFMDQIDNAPEEKSVRVITS
jgi:hypothetical protein